MRSSLISGNPATLALVGAAVAMLLQGVVVLCEFPAKMMLRRTIPHNQRVELSELRDRDSVRHRRFLQQQADKKDAIDFPLEGTYDPYRVGLYYTKVHLGTPPKEFHVQVDTGSDVLWVSCTSCKGCPTSSGLEIPIEFYDPPSSSTSTKISCGDKRCSKGLGFLSTNMECSDSNHQCSYKFKYGDGSATSGYYVSDLMHLDTMAVGNSTPSSKASTNVLFGCSTAQSGELSRSERAVDGIFGFGQQELSVISQLSSQGAAPDAFSHCLVGHGDGGGILVLGQILDPKMVYSPLVSSQPHYNLHLQSISVDDQKLSIDPSVFETSGNQKGTIIDSGTTLGYLAEEAYNPFVDAITESLPQSVQPFDAKGYKCYITTNSVAETFPMVSLNFAGDASMVLKPENYLLRQKTLDGESAWCIGFQKVKDQGVTILGDIVLKDKSVVYDLGAQRIGWADHDCTTPVNVSVKSSGHRRRTSSDGGSLRHTLYILTPTVVLASLLQLLLFGPNFLL